MRVLKQRLLSLLRRLPPPSWRIRRRRAQQSWCFLLCSLWWCLFRDEDLLVVGGGDSSGRSCIFDSFCKTVTIIHRRDEPRAQKVLQDRAFANEKSTLFGVQLWRKSKETKRVSSVIVENVKTGEISEHEFGGVFHLCWIRASQWVCQRFGHYQWSWLDCDWQSYENSYFWHLCHWWCSRKRTFVK